MTYTFQWFSTPIPHPRWLSQRPPKVKSWIRHWIIRMFRVTLSRKWQRPYIFGVLGVSYLCLSFTPNRRNFIIAVTHKLKLRKKRAISSKWLNIQLTNSFCDLHIVHMYFKINILKKYNFTTMYKFIRECRLQRTSLFKKNNINNFNSSVAKILGL